MAENQNLPDPETLHDLLDYDPETGVFTWLERDASYFTHEANWKGWNTKWAGRRAFTTKTRKGYLTGYLLNVPVYAHRVAWAFVHGVWPEQPVHHINGRCNDDRIANLRLETQSSLSMKFPGGNVSKSGHRGVHWHKESGKWSAMLRRQGKARYLGLFSELEDAIAARKAAELV